MEEIRNYSDPCSNGTITFEQILNDCDDCVPADAGYNKLKFTVNNIPSSMGVVYVVVDDTDPELLRVTISVCWRQKGRVIGEDTNLNGVLEGIEDVNHNNIIDSPVQLITILVNR
jgi:hypothetical protein